MACGLAIGLGGLGGCATQDPAMPPGEPGAEMLSGYPRVVAMDGLDRWLVADPAIVDRPEGGLLRVTQPIRSITDYEHLRVQFRFAYLDAQGRPMRAAEEWRYIVVPARTQVFMDGNALSTEAVDWRLEIRSAR
jgi:hypothetical protein